VKWPNKDQISILRIIVVGFAVDMDIDKRDGKQELLNSNLEGIVPPALLIPRDNKS